MAACKNELTSTSELHSGSEPSSTYISAAEPEYAEQEYTVLKDQTLPTNNNLYPPRTSSLQPPPASHPDAGSCGELDHTPATVEQTQLSRMFLRAKQRVAALFSLKTAPPRQSDPETPETCTNPKSDLFEQGRDYLIPVPGRKNKFWLRPPSQRTKDRAERKMLRRMSPHTRERRSVTVESTRKMLELEEEGIDVRDFQPEHDQAKDEEMKAEEERKAKAAANLEEHN